MDKETDAAIDRLGARNAPVIVRLPISHYCRKADWGLCHTGIAFSTLDASLKTYRHFRRANPEEKTVPVMVTDQGVVHGSHNILLWADARRKADAPSLYPEALAADIIAWEEWSDKLGHVTRREAYRVLASDPTPYTRGAIQRWKAKLARPLFRRILGLINAERYDEADPSRLREALERTISKLRETDTGFLFGDHVTGADLSTAALLAPLIPIAAVRGYDKVEGWGEFVQYVRTVKPNRSRRTGKRPIKEADWEALELLNSAGHVVVPQRNEPVPAV